MKIIRAGLLTTVQDRGRWGFQARGVPLSGAMDTYSHRLANRLAGNGPDAATLEVTLVGPHVEFESDARFVVAGAVFMLTLDGVTIQMNECVEARPGSCLRFGERLRGARAYLAVAGGIEVPQVLNSRSTHIVSRMGGYEGRALRAGDLIEKGRDPLFETRFPHSLPENLSSFLPEEGARVRVIAGENGRHLEGKRYRISTQSDRMGYRLEGPAIPTGAPAELISSPVPTGAIQVPPTGQPILLMADHATVGGYPIVATIISADLPVAGQLAPGNWIEFESCSLETADLALRECERMLAVDVA
jgi:antagonist of KipI